MAYIPNNPASTTAASVSLLGIARDVDTEQNLGIVVGDVTRIPSHDVQFAISTNPQKFSPPPRGYVKRSRYLLATLLGG